MQKIKRDMQKLLIKCIKLTPLYRPLKKMSNTRCLIKWLDACRPSPPPHYVKQLTLRKFAHKYNLNILVETGTYHGDMVNFMKNYFQKVYSIELDDILFSKAQKRFSSDDNIEIIHGDSSIELAKLIPSLNQPTLFWLDGHYSGSGTARGKKDTPVFEELTHIFNAANIDKSVIIIDDARCFGTDPNYPTIKELVLFIKENKSNVIIDIDGDSIRIVPEIDIS